MTIYRIKKQSAFGLVLTRRNRYKTLSAAQKAADRLNDKAGHLHRYYVAIETPAEKDVAEAFSKLRRTGRAKL